MESPDDSSKTEGPGDQPPDTKPETDLDDRRSQSRTETILSEIEDVTYKILRKHEDKKPE
ncbi:MAG: hypothetical protein WB421_21200 [Terriglobales bacterium]|jgi:hypothetical protein